MEKLNFQKISTKKSKISQLVKLAKIGFSPTRELNFEFSQAEKLWFSAKVRMPILGLSPRRELNFAVFVLKNGKKKVAAQRPIFEGCLGRNASFFKIKAEKSRILCPPKEAIFEGCFERELDFQRKKASKKRYPGGRGGPRLQWSAAEARPSINLLPVPYSTFLACSYLAAGYSPSASCWGAAGSTTRKRDNWPRGSALEASGMWVEVVGGG